MAIYGYTKNYKLIKPQFDTDTWHDYVYDNLDTIDAIMSAIYSSGNWQGFWQKNTHYDVGDVVIDRDTDTMYKVLVEHTTSENTFALEQAAHPTYYELWSPNNLAESWAIKMDGLVSSVDYSSKAYAISSGLIDAGSAKEWAIKSGTIGTTGEYSAKKYATDAHNDYISMTTDANVVAVGTNIASVHTVAIDISNVIDVAANKTNIDTVAGISTDVTTVASIANAVSNVSGIESEVLDVSDNRTDISTVASNIGDVNTIAGISTDVSTVADNDANVTTVATNISDVNTAATNIAAIQAAPTAASNAAASATLAQEWASKMDGQVASTDYSSKYYANESANSATSSANSATLASEWATKTDTTVDGNDYSAKWWALQANAERRIGQIIPSTIPLSDAGLHLADGSLISGSGSYSDFVSYMAGLVSTHPELFDTEANWQSSVSTYGVCGKYVYDSVNNTIRLPKLSGFVEGTLDPTKLGDLTEAGLPNITGKTGYNVTSSGDSYLDGSFYPFTASGDSYSPYSSGSSNRKIGFDASRSSSVYGNSSTVQPQAIKVFFYIVIATSTKTDIQVDIDEIATDLNGKADVDLSNINTSGKSFASGLAMPSSRYIDLTLGASGATYTAPANGYLFLSKTATAVGQYISLGKTYYQEGKTAGVSSETLKKGIQLLKGESVAVAYSAAGTTNYFRFIYAEGEPNV